MTYGINKKRDDAQQSLVALADGTRREILGIIKKNPSTVGEIASNLTVSRPAVSQHLKVLKEARLVYEDRRGTRHYFGLDPAGFAVVRKQIDGMWQEALDAFARYVDDKEKDKKRRKLTRRRKEK
jgi:DNA-binding transcriptional ArsR family regulator